MSNMSRDDLEIGMDMSDDRDLIEYQVALDEAEEASEPLFSFDQFMDCVEANRSTLPATVCDDELPF